MNTETFIDVLLQAPSDIKEEYKDSKLPKFIKHILMRRDIRRYCKIIDRFRNEGVILNQPILFQFLSILDNEFKPNPKYGDIKNILLIVNEKYMCLHASIYWDDTKATIKVNNNDPKFEVELSTIIDNKMSSYTFINNIMKCNVPEYKDKIHTVNDIVVENISRYFKEYIYKYTLEE